MIKDREQFDKFINLMPDLKDDEVYFISLSARNKYLTDEERVYYELGRTEMFQRTIVRAKEDFDYAMGKLEASLTYKHTRGGMKIPEKALVTYININPSSTLKAYEMFVKDMNKEVFQITQALRNDRDPNYVPMCNVERKLRNCIQKCGSRKYFIDIDVDSKNEDILNMMSYELRYVMYHIIKTHGGWHFIIEKDSLIKSVKLHEIVIKMNKLAEVEGGEVVFNKNQMVPLPGTLQAGELVEII